MGAGFSGAVIARVLADNGYEITVIDKRDHIGGNAFDFTNEYGIRVHKYGPHIFHTSNQRVVDWLSQFTKWIPYKHKVKALLEDGRLVTFPVNQETANIIGSANIVDIFYRPYTKKMWALDLEEIDPEIYQRVKIKEDDCDLYFPNNSFQALPQNGYESLIFNILQHDAIEIKLNQQFFKEMENTFDHTFNSMSIDEYFDFTFGLLPYRSIKFHTYTIPVPRIYPVSVINFTHSEPFTRVTEWRNFPNHNGSSSHTTITIEEPCDFQDNNLERYYPVKDLNNLNRDLYKKYKGLVGSNMTFIGRCGMYAYLDMDQAVSSALEIAKSFLMTNKLN